mmetsp:Transcript_32128/g.67138  ORF Transcript_32128/g.67138 Transcript_32128/m.67138 type:complete len:240 (+) Transcript_32128:2006-2725(+)
MVSLINDNVTVTLRTLGIRFHGLGGRKHFAVRTIRNQSDHRLLNDVSRSLDKIFLCWKIENFFGRLALFRHLVQEALVDPPLFVPVVHFIPVILLGEAIRIDHELFVEPGQDFQDLRFFVEDRGCSFRGVAQVFHFLVPYALDGSAPRFFKGKTPLDVLVVHNLLQVRVDVHPTVLGNTANEYRIVLAGPKRMRETRPRIRAKKLAKLVVIGSWIGSVGRSAAKCFHNFSGTIDVEARI